MNPEHWRKDFPLYQQKNPPLYADNACMTLKPVQVITKIREYYEQYPGCGGRSMHRFGKKVDEEIAKARSILKKFVGAKHEEEIVFTKNTTEAINLVAHSFAFSKGDLVLTSDKEHNSNLIPWQQLALRGVRHKVVPSKQDNTFDLDAFQECLTPEVKLVSLVHTSNLDGVTFPAKEIIKMAHDNDTKVLLDAAQSVPHQDVNVKKLDADFVGFSGHKMLGPTGTGVLYGKRALLEQLNPFMTGGETVQESTYAGATFEKPPHKFEAGLQHYAGMVGLGAAATYLGRIRSDLARHETALNKTVTEGLGDTVTLIGPRDAAQRGGVFSFTATMDAHDIALMLDQNNIMIRSGAHCVHSWFNAHKLPGSARLSFYLYNTQEEAARIVETVKKILGLG